MKARVWIVVINDENGVVGTPFFSDANATARVREWAAAIWDAIAEGNMPDDIDEALRRLREDYRYTGSAKIEENEVEVEITTDVAPAPKVCAYEALARVHGWTHDGDAPGFWFHAGAWGGDWKAAASWAGTDNAPAEHGTIYDNAADLCEEEDLGDPYRETAEERGWRMATPAEAKHGFSPFQHRDGEQREAASWVELCESEEIDVPAPAAPQSQEPEGGWATDAKTATPERSANKEAR